MNDSFSNQEQNDPLEFGTKTGIPLLFEVSIVVVKLIVVSVAVLTALFSLLAGATWLDILVRTCVSIIVFGLLGWLFIFFLGKFMIDSKLSELKEKQASESDENDGQDNRGSSVEFKV
jgi:hypothetical protein